MEALTALGNASRHEKGDLIRSKKTEMFALSNKLTSAPAATEWNLFF